VGIEAEPLGADRMILRRQQFGGLRILHHARILLRTNSEAVSFDALFTSRSV
jgi:hypothetical protein